MKTVLFIITLCFSTAIVAQEDKPIEVPQIAIKMKLTESVQFDGFSVTFKEVLEDSRCPKNVECAWAGRARVLVDIITKDGEVIEKTLVFNPGMGVLTSIVDQKEIQFLKLSPYPDANVEKEDRAPYALLVNTSKG